MNRRKAREFLLRTLYRQEFLETSLADVFKEVDPGSQRSYVEKVFEALTAHHREIDGRIAERTVGWRLERLALMDRNILRLGVCELLYVPDVPPEVAINEAVELAKIYGTEQAPLFVNGILDRIWKDAQARCESATDG
jgi:N utilization substance protein B